jgi:hypothetical protein
MLSIRGSCGGKVQYVLPGIDSNQEQPRSKDNWGIDLGKIFSQQKSEGAIALSCSSPAISSVGHKRKRLDESRSRLNSPPEDGLPARAAHLSRTGVFDCFPAGWRQEVCAPSRGTALVALSRSAGLTPELGQAAATMS